MYLIRKWCWEPLSLENVGSAVLRLVTAGEGAAIPHGVTALQTRCGELQPGGRGNGAWGGGVLCAHTEDRGTNGIVTEKLPGGEGSS